MDSAEWQATHWAYRWIKRVFHHPLKWLCRLRADGWQQFPKSGPVVVVPNHYSWADPVFVQAVLPRPGFYLAKESVFTNRFNTWFFTAAGQIKVDRVSGGNDAAVDVAVRELAGGRIIGVFPEGTRSVHPDLLRFKSGAVRVALRSGAPIVAVGILTDRFWPKGTLLPRVGRRVYIKVGAPYVVPGTPDDADDREFVAKATEDLQRRVEGLIRDCEAARAQGKRWRYP